MSKCIKCSETVTEGANYCPHCGVSLKTKRIDVGETFAGVPTHILNMLCYVAGFVTGIVFLNLDPFRKNSLIRFHAWQSILFSGVWLGFSILEKILNVFLSYIWFITSFVYLGLFVVWIILLVKAFNGERYKLPVLGDIAEEKAKL